MFSQPIYYNKNNPKEHNSLKHFPKLSVSVVIPVLNEAENIPSLFVRIPAMGLWTEMIFVEGHSTDGSEKVIKEEMKKNPDLKGVFLKQPETGKADAVFHGLDHASGSILMILDADLCVEPESLAHFYNAICKGKGKFIFGERLAKLSENNSMPFVNRIGNQLFGWTLSWILDEKISDALCGTKVFWRSDYEKMREVFEPYSKDDPYGDFSLLFGASTIGLEFISIPVAYHERTYGRSKIKPWLEGPKLVNLLFRFLFSQF